MVKENKVRDTEGGEQFWSSYAAHVACFCFKNNQVMFLLIMINYDETFFERPTWYPEGGHLMEVQL